MKITAKRAKARAWTACSKYIRQKYADENGYVSCVTCGVTKHWKEMDAGHFIRKARGNLAYFEIGEGPWSIIPYCNIWVQCKGCNGPKQGEMVKYTRFIQDTYGFGVETEMNDVLRGAKYTVEDYLEIERYCLEALEAL